jgi:lipopolysaccharide heptosyltransferase II
MRSLLVKVPNWMGDVLFSYDLLYSLSQGFHRLGLLVSDQHAELFSIFPLPNAEVLSYPAQNWPHLDSDTIRKIEDFRANAGLVLPNSIGSALVLRWAGVSPLYGYNHEHRRFLLKKWLQPSKVAVPHGEYFLRLIELFDLPALSYPAEANDQREPIAVIHPGASKIPRAWHLERFIDIARRLENNGMKIIFVSGESVPVDDFQIVLQPSLREFSDLLKRCAIFIGNDSGPLHFAQQCGAPVVGIYGPGDPKITGLRSISPGTVIYHAFPCSPCRQNFFTECEPSSNQKPFCIETITTGEVWKAVEKMIGRDKSRPYN